MAVAAAGNILFYSPDCEYSRQILGLVDQLKIRNQFVIININNSQYKLPAFVDRVPMIFIKASNQVVIDENLPEYIQTLAPAIASPNVNGPGEMLTMSDVGRGISDNFSFLDGGANAGGGSYGFLDSAATMQPQPTQQMQPQQGHNELPSIDASKQARFDAIEFERFTAQRDMDMASFKQSR